MKSIGQTLEIVADFNDRCGEGPLWDWRRNAFFWNDIAAQVIHRMDWRTEEVVSAPSAAQPAGMALATNGSLVIAGVNGIHTFTDGKIFPVMTGAPGQPTSWNDIVATPTGKLYAGTYFWGAMEMERTGALYLVDFVKKSATQLDEGIELSNGLALSPDGGTLYYADSTVRRIYVYDIDRATETLSRKRTFVTVPDDEGIPDGLTVDADGHVWSAQWYGGQVVRYDPAGKVERRIALPVKQVSSVAFGGEDLDILFITTAGEHWESKSIPRGYSTAAGKIGGPLFAIRPGVRGQREFEVKIETHPLDPL